VRAYGLTYHDVVPRAQRGESGFQGAGPDHYKVAPAALAEHLDALASAGRIPAPVRDSGGDGDRLFLTFDDGGASGLEHAAPLLEARGLRGHFFVTTSKIGAAGFLDPDGVRALHAAGHVVGSHAHTHAALTRLPSSEAAEELRRSKAVLEDLLGEEVDVLSVPTGYVNRLVLELAAAAGYRHLFTSEPWLQPRPVESALAYGRFAVTAGTPASRVVALGRGDRGAVWREAASWHGRKVAKRVAGPLYGSARRALLARGR
jgi:peptidoglycan/xylan/chitin deacetylase (PgdA/CDA1 family)